MGSRLEVLGLGGCKPISPSWHTSVLQRGTYSSKLSFIAYSLMDSWIKFLLDCKAGFDFILPVTHPFYMSYSQEDLVRSRHFTTENNFESIHTLGDLIGASVLSGSLTLRMDGQAGRSHGVSFLLYLIGGRKEHHDMYLLNFISCAYMHYHTYYSRDTKVLPAGTDSLTWSTLTITFVLESDTSGTDIVETVTNGQTGDTNKTYIFQNLPFFS